MEILFYGNCQLHAVLLTLNLPNNFKIHNIECWKDNINEHKFTSIIKNCDIIITQAIHDNYRDKQYLSTSYIIQHKKSSCKIIIIDSCHFDFYYFDSTYKRINNELINDPIVYHYKEMINCYNNNYSVDYYVNNFINNLELKTSEELEQIAENSLTELHKKYIISKNKYSNNNVFFITTCEYIKQNYKDKLLFYSVNHPTKYLIQFICKEIINILQINNTINYNIDYLTGIKCILYKCISKNVNFDVNNQNAYALGNIDNKKITQLYYDAYAKNDLQ
jgi:hypothetical protein